MIPLLVISISDSLAGNQGFIYGKITTRDGKTYTGTMRWGTQEYFWDDLFNATKVDNPWTKYAEKERGDDKRERSGKIKIFGLTIDQLGGFAFNHLLISRFGDIAKIEAGRRGKSTLVMKSGSEFEVTGSGDVGEKIQLLDDNLGKIKLKWDEIELIEFMPTPKSARTEGYRLRGKLITDEMEFNGFIMWDAEECISTDVLDGESDVGDMEIEFGNIRSIKRLSSRACQVTLKDGRKFELRGTNDVNDDNRGIYVQDDRYGKIEVNWDEFREVIYEDDGDSGQPYEAYKPARKLKGTVVTTDGEQVSGDVVFDYDESEDFEILNGMLDDMEFNIPFSMIVSITPRGGHASMVELVGGEKLRLEDAQDVTDSNDGLLIFQDKDKVRRLDWDRVEKITFVR